MDHPQRNQLRIDVLTLFPDVFEPLLQTSMVGIAAEKELVSYHLHNIRDYTSDKHGKVDDRPYGGGPGMVIKCEPVFKAWEAVREMDDPEGRLVLLTPQGKRFDQEMAGSFAREKRLVFLCGHYEGFDERIRQGLPVEEVSLGDYVLSSGETAAMVIIDAVVRLVPGVLGHQDSSTEESFADGMLEYPHYTRPENFRGMRVPDVLLSGHHRRIKEWREQKAARRTRLRRPELLEDSHKEHDSNG